MKILVAGAGHGGLVAAGLLAKQGHDVTVVDRDVALVSAVRQRYPELHVVAGRGEALPFDPGLFDVVVSIQNFHTFAPGLALGEWARVLRPQGRIGVAYLTRDDSVPWVRKLKRIVQTYLPEAMTSDFGAGSVSALDGSVYFPVVKHVSFRLWVPSSRIQLQDSARHAAGAENLAEGQLFAMLEEIGRLYDEYARVPDPLLLPYRIQCWKAKVDQSELTAAMIRGEDGLSISL